MIKQLKVTWLCGKKVVICLIILYKMVEEESKYGLDFIEKKIVHSWWTQTGRLNEMMKSRLFFLCQSK